MPLSLTSTEDEHGSRIHDDGVWNSVGVLCGGEYDGGDRRIAMKHEQVRHAKNA